VYLWTAVDPVIIIGLRDSAISRSSDRLCDHMTVENTGFYVIDIPSPDQLIATF